MKTLEVTDSTASLAQCIRGVRKMPVILTRKGKPVAAIVSIEDGDWETISLSLNPKFIALIEQARAQLRAEGGVSSAEVRRRLRLGKAPDTRA